jgi:formate/nitrite transporter FocA (FNT family)
VTDHSFPLSGGDANTPISWADVLKIWWLITWRAMLGSVLLGVGLGLVATMLGLLLHWPERIPSPVIWGAGFVAGLVWHVIVVRMALQKRYSNFRVSLSRLT